MKFNISISLAALATAACLSTAATADEGPFGVRMGADPASYSCTEGPTDGFYRCDSLPKTHPEMEFYLIQAEPGIGVCFVKGVGKDVNADPFGSVLRHRVDAIAEQVKVKYGDSEKGDFLRDGSIWDAPEDWMMGIVQEERFYLQRWERDTGATLPEELDSIYVAAVATDPETGYVVVEFYFTNHESCDKAKTKRGSGAF